MCTIVESGSEFKRNERKSIKCWKIVKETVEGEYIPLYYDETCRYHKGDTNSIDEGLLKIVDDGDDFLIGLKVHEGFHSYCDLEEALELNAAYCWMGCETKVIECEIPRGCLYIEGISSEKKTYVSSQIKVIGVYGMLNS